MPRRSRIRRRSAPRAWPPCATSRSRAWSSAARTWASCSTASSRRSSISRPSATSEVSGYWPASSSSPTRRRKPPSPARSSSRRRSSPARWTRASSSGPTSATRTARTATSSWSRRLSPFPRASSTRSSPASRPPWTPHWRPAMSAANAAPTKITYTSANADMSAFHKSFDEALQAVRAKAGQEHPLWIDGKAVKSPSPLIADVSPIDTSFVLGNFQSAAAEHVDLAVKAARRAQKAWGALAWQDRVKTMRKAAAAIRERKFEIAAIMSLEVGKSRLEAMGDAEESADLIDYYAKMVEDNDGYVKPLGKLLPNENTRSVLRPFGVFVCIAPYNFPMALSTGMSAAALLAGNAVVYKPAQDTPWTGLMLWECYKAAGIPGGLFSFVTGLGSVIGDALWKNPGVDGIVFTGSKEVGMRMVKEFSAAYPKPALME